MKTLKFTTQSFMFLQPSGKLCYNFRFHSFYINDLTNWKALGTYLIVRIKIY